MEGHDLAKKSFFENIKGYNIDNKRETQKKEYSKQKRKKICTISGSLKYYLVFEL
jgi:hypothetical protein